MVGSLGIGALAVAGAEPARAFGSGFPGYDVNEDARKRASDRLAKELEEQRDRARKAAAENAADALAGIGAGAADADGGAPQPPPCWPRPSCD